MSITSQLPPISLAQASSTLRALAQAAGQTVEARVLSHSGNGTTQVQIGRQVLSLVLPEGQPVGTTLTLSVQQSEGQLRLAIVAARPPGVPASTASPISSGVSAPATSVQLSAAALSGQPAASPPSQPVAVQPQSLPQPAPVASGAATGALSRAAPLSPSTAEARPVPGNTQVPAVATSAPAQPSAAAALPAASAENAPRTTPPGTLATAVAPGVAKAASAAASGGTAVPATGGVLVAAASGQGVQSQVVPPAGTAGSTAPAQTVLQAPVGGNAPLGRIDIPYAVAAPAVVPAQVSSVTGSASNALPPVAQTVAASTVGQHAPPPGTSAPPPPTGSAAALAPVATPSAPATPQAALAQMVQQSLPRQDSVVGLTTALAAIAGKVAVPEPVAKAMQQVLAMRVPLDTGQLNGTAIRGAIQRSGVFQEALLAAGQAQAAAGDVKSALLSLRQSLGAWLGSQAPVAQVSGVAPPLRGQVPRARLADGASSEMPDDPLEVGKVLIERTEAALSRLRLHQHASLPESGAPRQDAQWSLDLPVMVAGQQHLLHMQIHRDPEKEADRPEDRGWQVRFAINLAERGEVGAQISLRGKTAGVLIWADDAATANSLATAADDLRDAIAEIGLVPGAIVIRAGAPAPPTPPAAGTRHYVDATR